MDDEARVRFGEFVAARTHTLIRVAYMLTGDQHAAEDLLQSALTKTAARWRTLRHEDPEGYVRTVMYREQVSWWRRLGRHREVAVDPPPDRVAADTTGNTDLRLSVRTALLRLPPAQRAVLVLRYFEDLTETQAADVLGCSVGTVRSRTHRALARLRELLPADTDVQLTEVLR
ncbi:SigE family RNA polymerase sigma factor [Planosporangium sp. 12N6]|uniref:SigE family RNA polymerase sigma factor n=1 Tax=Planosporangium spinosum TaxID=3402278 RepID=UPI003CF194CD